MNNPVISKKSETLRRLSHAIFELEATKGHLLWKVTDLVRKSNLSRALIYRYLGSSKNEILICALKNFIIDFYGFDQSKASLSFSERIRNARERMILNPEAILFYHKWRSKNSELQQEFIEIESKFQRKLKKLFPHLSESEVLERHAIIHGLVTAPFLSGKQAAEIYARLCG